ncbi:MAG: hypothetical protein A2268_12555 [Candidatus Raymondbacteria bacterium RifOxyA12_full_50_37]|uniref:DUF4468 domain-containing protein n=1 Tax=Candidatus Raymondbacteria bacterium RIFOXYD12_FULL_49_13 TaxID=1817890 RepID=A0A1F7FAS8_UNCRA|nr:MAG: hypothetical protein A2268_12555 [Candidatus Raymondbacteria bacterium RifOxyA12_full_50_37]OGJ91007.1 MAG: hypothetical protein A2248_00575 [Candidatus Raymondbacteria bacterium RIFOXYA2_FULL_49_16]OGJ97444.1 MAG: hypothetical protein A2453_10125 [Candidatus Raymondbacteria bacterium RIFOXYC2_FULL_50_21]OGK01763.1 MAG: hypothetical protein A2350_17575 [Candidatus Raymondbacteria bacterium RifOxyB12_full_50_8]OGK03586.1 MAG: hypothetical protein A2519_11770 [Candidatus Raymondbacteria b
MKHMKLYLAFSLVVAILCAGCAPDFTFSRKGLEIPMTTATDQTVKDLTSIAVGILTEDNFIVEHANADVGLVTTEWGGIHLGMWTFARIRFSINILKDLKAIKIRPTVEYRTLFSSWVDANGLPIAKKHQNKINDYLTSVSERLYKRFSARLGEQTP